MFVSTAGLASSSWSARSRTACGDGPRSSRAPRERSVCGRAKPQKPTVGCSRHGRSGRLPPRWTSTRSSLHAGMACSPGRLPLRVREVRKTTASGSSTGSVESLQKKMAEERQPLPPPLRPWPRPARLVAVPPRAPTSPGRSPHRLPRARRVQHLGPTGEPAVVAACGWAVVVLAFGKKEGVQRDDRLRAGREATPRRRRSSRRRDRVQERACRFQHPLGRGGLRRP